MYINMSLKRSTFKYLEQEVADYYITIKNIEELSNDIIYSSPPYKEIRTNDPSDIVYHSVSLLVTNKLLKRMKETVAAIDVAFIEIDPFIREVLEDKYWKRIHLSWTEVSHLHGSEVRTVYRWRRVFIEDVAKRLGLN